MYFGQPYDLAMFLTGWPLFREGRRGRSWRAWCSSWRPSCWRILRAVRRSRSGRPPGTVLYCSHLHLHSFPLASPEPEVVVTRGILKQLDSEGATPQVGAGSCFRAGRLFTSQTNIHLHFYASRSKESILILSLPHLPPQPPKPKPGPLPRNVAMAAILKVL